MAEKKQSVFDVLNNLNVKEHTEKKKSGSKKNEDTGIWEDVYLSYLSWPWAWAEVKKRYPEAHYEIQMFNGLPYLFDENTGYMCFTKVTIEGVTHEMWLPVMDGANKAMKKNSYKYSTKSGEKQVEAATMFDINKTIMRCLVKNLAMFGLGLYIYAGEDLPESESESEEMKTKESTKKDQPNESEENKRAITSADHQMSIVNDADIEMLKAIFKQHEVSEEFVLKLYNIHSMNGISRKMYDNMMKNIKKIKEKQEVSKSE